MQKPAALSARPSTPELGWLGDARRHGMLGRLPDALVALLVRSGQRIEFPPGTIGLRWDEGPKAAIVDRASASGLLAEGRRVLGTQQDLATAVGSVREVVAATLGHLKREGLIDVRRGVVVILDPDRLAREANAIIGAAG